MIPDPQQPYDDPLWRATMGRLHAGAIGYGIGMGLLVAALIWKWPF